MKLNALDTRTNKLRNFLLLYVNSFPSFKCTDFVNRVWELWVTTHIIQDKSTVWGPDMNTCCTLRCQLKHLKQFRTCNTSKWKTRHWRYWTWCVAKQPLWLSLNTHMELPIISGLYVLWLLNESTSCGLMTRFNTDSRKFVIVRRWLFGCVNS